jgi:hypothetical protein
MDFFLVSGLKSCLKSRIIVTEISSREGVVSEYVPEVLQSRVCGECGRWITWSLVEHCAICGKAMCNACLSVIRPCERCHRVRNTHLTMDCFDVRLCMYCAASNDRKVSKCRPGEGLESV